MALIDTAEELQAANSSITKQLSVSSLQSFLDTAEWNIITPVVGFEQLQELIAGKDAFAEGSAELQALRLLQRAAVNLALAEYAAFGAVVVDDMGIGVLSGDKKAPASDKKVMALRKQASAYGWGALEQCLRFFENNLGRFAKYTASGERKANLSCFISFSTDFPQKVRVSAELLFGLRAVVEQCQDNYLGNLLGEALINRLKDSIYNRIISPAESQALTYIRRALGSVVLAEAVALRLATLDVTGLYQLSETVGGISGNVENRSSADLNRVEAIMNKLRRDGEADLERLRKWLNEHSAEFPEYAKSTSDVLGSMNENPDSKIFFI